ncbi:phosphatase PAP2 family protein [Sulfurimonas sp. HSL3-7]|uniref:phosphatase PAP2 family protein n=1 Tax=Sulfonitrofixus jiaomeiensis TaxID=3131938 RepID=UPI0031F92204
MLKILPICIVSILLYSGCSTHGSYWPGGERWREAALNAATDPVTWIPAAGAVAVAAGGFDDKISDWAREEAPVFGSEKRANEMSDDFRDYARYGMLATTFMVYDGEEYWLPLAERIVVEYAGVVATDRVTGWLKKKSERERPNGTNTRSFPSGHSSAAFAYAAMANRNIDRLPLTQGWKYAAQTVETSFAVLTAWARVEAGAHYPSDVLAGAALGNFISLLLHDAFLGKESTLRIRTDTQGGDTLLVLEKAF